jgi:CheY-like chemotaxis protein
MDELAAVLVVDDDEVIRTGLERLLSRQGYAISTATTAEEGLAQLEQQHYDLVLTDFQMPGMDGLELLGRIKQASPDTPVIMITGHAETDTVIQALRRGVSDFVTKPYEPPELLNIVKREVAKAIARRPTAAPVGPAAVLGLQLSAAQLDEIDGMLAELRAETSARCVVVIEGNGYVISAKGVIEDINLSALAALMAGNAAATSGIASLIGEGSAFNLNYHEGSRYSIYSASLSRDLFLLVVFGQDVKSGMVLYVTKQTLPRLRAIAEEAERAQPTPLARASITDASGQPEPALAATALGAAPAEAGLALPEEGKLFSFDELMTSGLLDDTALKSLDDEFKKIWGP